MRRDAKLLVEDPSTPLTDMFRSVFTDIYSDIFRVSDIEIKSDADEEL